jgi:hypothetical protein
MTVYVTGQQNFQGSIAEISEHVRKVLHSEALYKRITEMPDGTHFTATIRPRMPLLLSTALTVALEDTVSGTIVKVSTKSQSLILGDITGMYDGYIEDLFRRVNTSIKRERSKDLSVGSVYLTRSYAANHILIPGIIACLFLAIFLFVTNFNFLIAEVLAFTVMLTLMALFVSISNLLKRT